MHDAAVLSRQCRRVPMSKEATYRGWSASGWSRITMAPGGSSRGSLESRGKQVPNHWLVSTKARLRPSSAVVLQEKETPQPRGGGFQALQDGAGWRPPTEPSRRSGARPLLLVPPRAHRVPEQVPGPGASAGRTRRGRPRPAPGRRGGPPVQPVGRLARPKAAPALPPASTRSSGEQSAPRNRPFLWAFPLACRGAGPRTVPAHGPSTSDSQSPGEKGRRPASGPPPGPSAAQRRPAAEDCVVCVASSVVGRPGVVRASPCPRGCSVAQLISRPGAATASPVASATQTSPGHGEGSVARGARCPPERAHSSARKARTRTGSALRRRAPVILAQWAQKVVVADPRLSRHRKRRRGRKPRTRSIKSLMSACHRNGGTALIPTGTLTAASCHSAPGPRNVPSEACRRGASERARVCPPPRAAIRPAGTI